MGTRKLKSESRKHCSADRQKDKKKKKRNEKKRERERDKQRRSVSRLRFFSRKTHRKNSNRDKTGHGIKEYRQRKDQRKSQGLFV